MNKLEKDILQFLLDGKVNSDTSIEKNFGITKEELDLVYNNLVNEGYLETYSDYEKREKLLKLQDIGDAILSDDIYITEEMLNLLESPSKNSCSSCSKGCSSGGCSSGGCSTSDDIDYSKVLVLTEKAFEL